MNWEAIGAIGEFVGAIGVIASLVYVGYQIKETRKAARAAIAQARTDLGVQLISSRYTSDIADVLVKSLSDPDSLTKSERFKRPNERKPHSTATPDVYIASTYRPTSFKWRASSSCSLEAR